MVTNPCGWTRITLCGIAVLGMVTLAVPSAAAVITVNTTDDELNTDGDCSLREAVNAANQDIAVDGCPAGAGPDTLVLPTGTFTVATGGGSSALVITDDLYVAGAGPSATVIQASDTRGTAARRVMWVASGTTVVLERLTVRHGNTTSSGGGIYSSGVLTLTDAWVVMNDAGAAGGGILNQSVGTLTLHNAVVDDNAAAASLFNTGGGGVMNFGLMSLSHSTVSRNITNRGGGGVLNFGSLTAVNATFSANVAGGAGGGGLRNAGPASLTNVTITGNTTTSLGGGLRAVLGSVSLHNTIVAANGGGGGSPDCEALASTAASLGYNLIGDGSGCGLTPQATDQVGSAGAPIDPSLGPLQNNGGATPTHALLTGSPALDAGDDGVTLLPLNLTTDQRGSPRLVGVHVDVGAFEYGTAADNSPPIVTPPDDLTMEVDHDGGVPAADAALAAFLNAATAEDDVDGRVPVSHDAPVMFSMGETPVTFEATDDAGNIGMAQAMVTITYVDPHPGGSPQDMIQRLINQISESDLHRRVKRPFINKLRQAARLLDGGQVRPAVTALHTLLDQIERMVGGRWLTRDDAAWIHAAVVDILGALGVPPPTDERPETESPSTESPSDEGSNHDTTNETNDTSTSDATETGDTHESGDSPHADQAEENDSHQESEDSNDAEDEHENESNDHNADDALGDEDESGDGTRAAEQMVDELLDSVEELDIERRIKRRLVDLLRRAKRDLEHGRTERAQEVLRELIERLEEADSEEIDHETAAELRTAVERIIVGLQ